MAGLQKKAKKTLNKVNINPNWALLQQKLKSSDEYKPQSRKCDSVLGKRKGRLDSEAQISEINPLTPTSTDCRLTDVVAMDCEMVGVGANRSALGRVTLVNELGNVVYDEYVRPIEHVIDFRTEVSGIRPHHLKKAKTFQAAQKKVVEMLQGRVLVGHALQNDLKALLMSHPKKDLRDTSEDGRKRALRHLAEEFLGVKIQNGEHCSIEDARAAMLLYQKLKKKWEKDVKNQSKLIKKQSKRGPKRKRVDIPYASEAS